MVDFLEQHFIESSIPRDRIFDPRDERFEGSFTHLGHELSMVITFCESFNNIDNTGISSMTITINNEILYSHILSSIGEEKITNNTELADKLKIRCVKSATTTTNLPIFIFETPSAIIHLRCNKYASYDWFREYVFC
jgi:hypothetical protein